MRLRLRLAVMTGALWLPLMPAAAQPLADQAHTPPTVVGDTIPVPLTTSHGDAVRGRAIVTNRQVGLCLLCHTGPFPEERFQGSLAPDLSGAGSRWSEGQLRLRLVDGRRFNPESIMPAYYRSEGLNRVGPVWQGKTILNAQQIEDVLAFVQTLKN